MKTFNLFLISLAFYLGLQSAAFGALTFQVDFGPDGTNDTEWTTGLNTIMTLDIYVSNVPSPGLVSMGFFLDYDSTALEVVDEGTGIDSENWLMRRLDTASPGRITLVGARLGPGGIPGDHIKLATVKFKAKGVLPVELWLHDRGPTVDDFVLADGTVLDSDIGSGIKLATVIIRVGDMDGDGDIDGSDLFLFSEQFNVCTGDCIGDFDADNDVDNDDLGGLAPNFGKD